MTRIDTIANTTYSKRGSTQSSCDNAPKGIWAAIQSISRGRSAWSYVESQLNHSHIREMEPKKWATRLSSSGRGLSWTRMKSICFWGTSGKAPVTIRTAQVQHANFRKWLGSQSVWTMKCSTKVLISISVSQFKAKRSAVSNACHQKSIKTITSKTLPLLSLSNTLLSRTPEWVALVVSPEANWTIFSNRSSRNTRSAP